MESALSNPESLEFIDKVLQGLLEKQTAFEK